MDDNGRCQNGRNKHDQYKSIHSQWMIPPHLMKDHHALTMKFMSILTERDTAIQERNLAISEKKAALVERDMAILQRDSAIDERNDALVERDDAMAALEYRENSAMKGSSGHTCQPGYGVPHGAKHSHHLQHMHYQSHLSEAPYNSREMHISDAFPISEAASETVKPLQAKQTKETKVLSATKKVAKLSRKGKRGGDDCNKRITVAKLHDWKTLQFMRGSSNDLNKQVAAVSKPEWKGQDLSLNQVTFDDSTMPVPGCSCTGALQHCYKWGKGGWQSACCTTTLSMYPLPVMPNKRHARLGGRKMSGSAFTKLLSRLAAEGHDLSIPLDLKDHWAKHGTNRYITIRKFLQRCQFKGDCSL